MRRHPFLALFLIATIPVLAVADIGDPLELVALPDDPIVVGDTISLTVNDGTEGDMAFLFFGTELGTFPIMELELDLLPTGLIPLGAFPTDGTLGYEFELAQVPPPLVGLTLHLQAASAGFDFVPGAPPVITLRKSNLDYLMFE